MVTSFKAVPFTQFNSRSLQLHILTWCGTNNKLSLWIALCTCRARLIFPGMDRGSCVDRTTLPWSQESNSFICPGRWWWMPAFVAVAEFITQLLWGPGPRRWEDSPSAFWNRAIKFTLQHWITFVQGHLVRVQSNNVARAMTCINYHGGTRTWVAQREPNLILFWIWIHNFRALLHPHAWHGQLASGVPKPQKPRSEIFIIFIGGKET